MADLFIGVDVGGTNIKAGLVTEDGVILTEKKVPTHADKGHEYILKHIAGIVNDLKKGENVKGAGIGMPGQVDFKRGIFLAGPNLPGCRNVHIVEAMEKELSMPVILDNDANLAALAEFSAGAAKGFDSGMLVTLGTGVGGGIIINGEIFHGASGAAGEFGHIIVKTDGPVCSCGRRGCVEAFAGTPALLRSLQEKLDKGRVSVLKDVPPDKRTPKLLSEAAQKGDEAAIEVFSEAGFYLGVGLANVINLLELQRIVVGGGVANAGNFILDPARESFYKTALKDSVKGVEIVPAKLGNSAGLVGAAEMVKRKVRKGNF